MSDAFRTCLAFVLDREGGLSNHKADRGGLTNHGVTQKLYDRYRTRCGLPTQSVRKITPGEIEDLYYRLFWITAGCDRLPLPLALCVFDFAVHSGVGRAVKGLQECLGTVPDGTIGPATLRTIAVSDLRDLIREYVTLRWQFLERLSRSDSDQHVFRKGWLKNRMRKVKARAIELYTQSS